MGSATSCVGPASLRCSSAPARYCNGDRPVKSRISNRSSAPGSPWSNSGLPSSSWGRSSRQEKIFCLRRGPMNSTGCTSHVAPVPFDDLLPQMEQALGRSPAEVFANLEREPYAAASIAQIHRATLTSGTPVILKIRRPGIVAKADADLRILEHLAYLAEQEIPEARRYRPVDVVGQLRRSLERELDLAVEARNTERFARNFAGDLDVLIPRIYWEWTSSSMNVQEHIEGIRGDDLEAIDNAGLDRKAIGARGVDVMLKMILIDGFFQADPHPGNVMCLPGNRIALIDFGMVGRLSPARRGQLVNLLAGFVHHDEEAMLEVLLDWRGSDSVNEARLAADLGALAVDYSEGQLKDLKIVALLHR